MKYVVSTEDDCQIVPSIKQVADLLLKMGLDPEEKPRVADYLEGKLRAEFWAGFRLAQVGRVHIREAKEL